ncbi:AI-2E family transporter [Sphingomonas sp. MMS24-JH45]
MSNSASMLTRRAFSDRGRRAAFLLAFGVGLYVTFSCCAMASNGTRSSVPCRSNAGWRSGWEKFVGVVRATIKGSGVVAIVQGALGAITFALVGLPAAALLWGMLMAIAALLPAVGPAIIWVPVALYLGATGAVWQAGVVVAWACW